MTGRVRNIDDDVNIVILSDIHLGKNTESTIEGLRYVFKYELTRAETDILVISGDLFDSILTSVDVVDLEIMHVLHEMLEACALNDIQLRVLEGTPSHDRTQSKLIPMLQSIVNSDCDVKYISDVHVEKNAKYGLNILYVPDEWRELSSDTVMDCAEAIAIAGLDKVDIAIMHGVFDFQLPRKALVDLQEIVFRPHDFKRMVKHACFIGHHHTHAKYRSDNFYIWVPGSFNRLCHGEEEAKGYLRVKYNRKTGCAVTFVENKFAEKYLSFDLTHLADDCSVEEVIAELNSLMVGFSPKDKSNRVHGRVILKRSNVNLSYIRTLEKQTQRLTLKLVAGSDEVEEMMIPVDVVDGPEPLHYSPDAINAVLTNAIGDSNLYKHHTNDELTNIVRDLMDG